MDPERHTARCEACGQSDWTVEVELRDPNIVRIIGTCLDCHQEAILLEVAATDNPAEPPLPL